MGYTNTKTDWVKIAKEAREAAEACINGLRREHRGAHFIHREVELIACDDQGERIGDPIAYLTVKELSGSKLAELVKLHAPAQYNYIAVQGGCDGYDSFADFMRYPDDYDPGCDWWDVLSCEADNLPSPADRVTVTGERFAGSYL